MIIPSIDIRDGRAVQLRRGREFILDGGDPLDRLEQFSVAGDVSIVDLDAAMGRGCNTELIRRMLRRHPCRVGGGIRTQTDAEAWLDAGASEIVIGTAATPELLGALPRDRVIAAVDAELGKVLIDGWREHTRDHVLDRVARLRDLVSGFLFTQVEHEGAMAGFDSDLLQQVVAAAEGTRITAAGGITTAREIAELDALGVDAQVGMALYSERLSLGDAVAAVLVKAIDNEYWPTIVRETSGEVLGLVWSTRETLADAVNQRRGVYWSRSRGAKWFKGETSGNTQELVRVHVDCDRDALEFTVRQAGTGFCHLGTRTCFGDGFSLAALERTIRRRIAAGDPDSGTVKVATDAELLAAKLLEEANELLAANTRSDVIHEAADLLYFMLVTMARSDVSLTAVVAELEHRSRRSSRRPMRAKGAASARRS
jgi:phosphoribosyl-ATP pyrophosphohydrolase/phosphoribosyl-AMP cyclohydrolase